MEVKIGDIVKIISVHKHNSNHPNFDYKISFDESELNTYTKVLDIQKVLGGEAYVVQCKKGITFLRRSAFILVNLKLTEQDVCDIIQILDRLNIK